MVGACTKLKHHQQSGRLRRVRRRVYRLVHFPAGEHEDLVSLWLWSEQAGVFSHETALALHDLSDALPARLHLTLPAAWRKRRFRLSDPVVLRHADIAHDARTWAGPVPITAVARTLNDLARADVSPEILRQAAQQALRRGLAARGDLLEVERALEPFGGLEP